jgi:hypothetical protein
MLLHVSWWHRLLWVRQWKIFLNCTFWTLEDIHWL